MLQVKTKNSTYRIHGERMMQVCGTPLSQFPTGEWVNAEVRGITLGCRMKISVAGDFLTTSPVTCIEEVE